MVIRGSPEPKNIKHRPRAPKVRHGGGIDDGWDWESAGFDVISIERGWQMTLLFGPDEGAVIEVMDGKARVVSVMVEVEIVGPTEDEIEQVGLSLTRPHDGGAPI